MANDFLTPLIFLIDLYDNGCQNTLYDGNEEVLIFIKSLGLFPYYGCWYSRRCWCICLLNVKMVYEFQIIIVVEFHSCSPDAEITFCPKAVCR